MTEVEWFQSMEPVPMVDYLLSRHKGGKNHERKLTLFACACCRRIWDLMPTSSCKDAVEMGERYADGLATEQERQTAWCSAFDSAVAVGIRLDVDYHRENVEWGCVPGGLAAIAALGVVGFGNVNAVQVAGCAVGELAIDPIGMGFQDTEEYDHIVTMEQSVQAALLRDIFGNPFRPVNIAATWLTTTVKQLAAAIYEEHVFDHLPILADALEDAGCTNADILNHCRQPGEHVRGCWVVDLLLGKT